MGYFCTSSTRNLLYIVELNQGSELFDTLVPDGGPWAPLITYLKEIARQHSEGNFPS